MAPNPLYDVLLWVHDHLRRDLATLRKLAVRVEAGATSATVEKAIRSLKTNGPLWQLKTNCLTYCRFVHGHHGNEDANIFPAVKRAEPSLRGAVDRLVADHRRVAEMLDEIEAAARFLSDDPSSRTRLAGALDDLSRHLLDHLRREESLLQPVLARWTRWPGH